LDLVLLLLASDPSTKGKTKKSWVEEALPSSSKDGDLRTDSDERELKVKSAVEGIGRRKERAEKRTKARRRRRE